MNSQTYLEILNRRLLRNFPTLSARSPLCVKYPRLIYQHDGATAHTSGDVKRYFQEKEIEVIDWPSQSPDLNLIESVWSQLKYNLKRSYQNLEDLQEDIISSSQSIDCFYIKKNYIRV